MEIFGAAASPSVIYFVQLLPDSDADLYQSSFVRKNPNKKSHGRNFRVIVAAMVRSDRERRQSAPGSLFKALVDAQNLLCPLGSLISSVFADTGSVRPRGRVAAEGFRTSVAKPLDQVMYTSSITTVCYATDSSSKKRFRMRGRGFVALSVRNPHRLSSRNVRCIGWSV